MARPDTILASELLSCEVLALPAGEILGTVVDYAIAPAGCVLAIGILPAQWYRGGLALAPAALTSIATERVGVADKAQLTAFAPADGALTFNELRDKQVLGQDARLYGRLTDFTFRVTDGQICELVVQDARGGSSRIAVAALHTAGRDYIVIEPIKSAANAAPGAQASVAIAAAPPEWRDQLSPPARQAAIPATCAAAASAAPDSPPPAVAQPEVQPKPDDAALFVELPRPARLSKVDQKKADFLLGKPAHRDICAPDKSLLVARGQPLSEQAIAALALHGLLGDIFVELTVSR